MALATFEAYYSRPIAPTRRIALGTMDLPVDPSPGFGGVLLGGIVARFARELDDDADEEFEILLNELERRPKIGQPRLRHRLQADRVGLARCRHRLFAEGERVQFVFDDEVGTAIQHVVCAAYAAAACEPEHRGGVFAALRKGLQWVGPIDDSLVRYLSDLRSMSSVRGADPEGWARTRLGVEGSPMGDELRSAVARYLLRERSEVQALQDAMAEAAPFKRSADPDDAAS